MRDADEPVPCPRCGEPTDRDDRYCPACRAEWALWSQRMLAGP